MFFTETWLSEDHFPDEYSFSQFQMPVKVFRSHGGVVIYAKDHIVFKEVHSPEKMEDAVWIEVKTANAVSRLYGCIYRPPNSIPENNELLLKNMKWASSAYKEVIILGDFNMPTIDWKVKPREHSRQSS